MWSEVNTPVSIRTDHSPPPRDLASLGILHMNDLVAVDDTTPSQLKTCFKGMRRVTRILIRHARNLRRMRYGKALLHLSIKKPNVVLKYIMRTAEGVADTPSLPTDLSVIRDETTGHLITAREEVIAKITQMKTVALSPDPTLLPRAPFPWLGLRCT